jgi:CHAT domain-containing protein/tetratricopeptide (TPR) repeat protein
MALRTAVYASSMGKAARIRRSRREAAADDDCLLAVLGAESLDEFEEQIEQHPELLSEATFKHLASYERSPEFGAPFALLAELLRGSRTAPHLAWERFRVELAALDERGAQLYRELEEIDRLLAGDSVEAALLRIDAAMAAALEAGQGLTVGALHDLRGRALLQRWSEDRASDLDGAIAAFQAALALTAHSEQAARTYMNLALAMAQHPGGDRHEASRDAVAMLRRALEVLDASAPPEASAIIQTNLASALLGQTDGDRVPALREAVVLCRAALEYRSPSRNAYDWAHTQLNLGAALEQLSGLGLAERQEAIAAYESVIVEGDRLGTRWLLGAAHFSLGRLYNGVAHPNAKEMIEAHESAGLDDLMENRETLQRARIHLEQALVDLEEAPDRLYRGRAYAELAPILESLGETPAAIDAAERALEILTPATDPAACARAAGHLAGMFAGAQRWDSAADTYRLAVGTSEMVFHTRLETESREADIRSAGNLLRWAAFAIAQTGAIREAALTLESGRTREMRRRFGLEADSRAQLDGLPRELIEEYMAASADVLSAPLGLAAATATRRLQQVLAAIRAQEGFEQFAMGASAADLVKAVEPGWPLLYVNQTPLGTMLLLVKATDDGTIEHLKMLPDLTSTGVFARLALGSDSDAPGGAKGDRAYLFAAANVGEVRMDMGPVLEDMLPWLGRALSEPIHQMLVRHAAAGVTLVVSGPLAAAPLHAAPLHPDGRCLLDELEVRYAPSAVSSATALRRASAREDAPPKLVALADPQRGDPRRHLQAAEAEVREIACHFRPDSQRIAVGAAATAGFLEANARDAKYLHLACHAAGGMFDGTQAGIALADRVLSPFELTAVGRLRARLVAISACQTAQSGIAEMPDEVFSIGTAMLTAGSACAIATLWEVHDAAAALVMTRTYEEMMEGGHRPPEALRRAQLWLRDLTHEAEREYLAGHPLLAENLRRRRARGEPVGGSSRADAEPNPSKHRYAHPDYWAPFVAVGA